MAQTAQGSVGHFWSESYGQLYPTLKRLQARGWIRIFEERQGRAGRPAVAYDITASGRRALEAWLAEPPELRPPRNELLLKLFFGQAAGADVCWRHVVGERERASASLRELEEIETMLQRDHTKHPQQPFWLTTVRYGQRMQRALMGWCDETLEALESRLKSSN